MKAIVYQKYGPPDVLQLKDVTKPVPGDDEVLVRVHAASANPADWHVMRGDPFFIRLALGPLKPKHPILGADIAGRVEAVGKDVRQFQPGDEVFGNVSQSGFGAFAEYASVPEKALSPKPARLTFEQAAAVPLAALTALQGLRDKGRIRAGHKVLINGASGGVGTFAVQIAKAFGAEVTGVCSARNVELVRSIGADRVIDYTRDEVTRRPERYDLILDTAAFRSPWEYRRLLNPHGIYVLVGGSTARMFQMGFLMPLARMTGNRRIELVMSKPNQKDLLVLKDLIEAGKLTPVIDRSYQLAEVPEAIRYLEEGHARGKVLITVH
jgi:NADPH:quinone reductase-like Zn-dependent oxidoreductase